MNKLKISKTGFTKIVCTVVSKPQWVGFSNTKTDYDKFGSWEKIFFDTLAWAFFPFFSQESSKIIKAKNFSKIT